MTSLRFQGVPLSVIRFFFCLCIYPVVGLTSSLPLLPPSSCSSAYTFTPPQYSFPLPFLYGMYSTIHYHPPNITPIFSLPVKCHLPGCYTLSCNYRQTDRQMYRGMWISSWDIYDWEYALFLFITLVTSPNILFSSTHFPENCTIYLSLQLHKILSCKCTFSLSIHPMERSPLPWVGSLQDLGIDWLDDFKATVNKIVFLISWLCLSLINRKGIHCVC